MKVKIDNYANALYIYIQEKINSIENTILADEFYKLKGMINFDMDLKWNITWIEVLPINFIEDYKNIKYEFIYNSWLKINFSSSINSDKLFLCDNNIIIYLNKNWNVNSIEIYNIFNKNNFSEEIIFQ